MKNVYFFAILLLTSYEILAKSNFVSQTPNGSVNSCATCHTSNTNYSLNPFGRTINSGYLSSGKITWNATLANIDSDGDGFTNGIELQDPQGTWISGTLSPGDVEKVSNPGVKSSIPTSVLLNYETQDLSIYSIYPNPFLENISIKYRNNSSGFVAVSIYNTSGMLIKSLVSEFQIVGDYSIIWDGKDNSGSLLPSGTYFVSVKCNDMIKYKSIKYTR